MNCPTRDPEPKFDGRFNQNPSLLDNDLNTNRSSNTIANGGSRYNSDIEIISPAAGTSSIPSPPLSTGASNGNGSFANRVAASWSRFRDSPETPTYELEMSPIDSLRTMKAPLTYANSLIGSNLTPSTREQIYPSSQLPKRSGNLGRFDRIRGAFRKYLQFIGPGFMIAVAYIDPGNYSTDVAAGAMFRFKLLFVILLSNVFAIFLQSLCAKLGSVTGLDLAQNCRTHFPRWLCIILYLLAETAIVATDLAEVIGTAISLNILFKVPLVAGVAITIVDVLIVLLAYKPNGSLKAVRWFEYAVAVLVLAVVICFCVELGGIRDTSVGEVFKGYLPSKTVFSSDGLYYSCGILGATVMPHSLYLGSGLVQPRLREFDEANNNFSYDPNDSVEEMKYRPSVAAIRHALKYSIIELAVSLFTFALFVNSAILIVSGATLSDTPGAADADLFSIHDMLSTQLSAAAGTVFALALLFSGQSAGIVCTLAGQMVSEGFLHWTMRPWLRRLITRTIAILPCIVVAGAVGREGLAEVINLSQVVLSILLPFVSAPLIYFTCRKKYMRVPVIVSPATADDVSASFELNSREMEYVDFSNGKFVTVVGVLIWSLICGLNVYLIVLLGLGEA
ncbi:natural resistance-associated macrophage protein-domain-containing protein [Lipomyces arxii]|uniref:natural resistance-associated macrophage protein-domain-containing protein n=1 Tax=Lipomyces arxii TaxID=56418 RepID=UPI0034CE6AFD